MHGQVYARVFTRHILVCSFSRQTAVPNGVVCPPHSLLRNPSMVECLQILPTFSVPFLLLTLCHAPFYNFFFLTSLFTTRESSSPGSLRGIVPRSEDAEISV